MSQMRMFVPSAVAVIVQSHYVECEGWRCLVIVQRDGESWADSYRATYSALSAAELADVIDAETTGALFSA